MQHALAVAPADPALLLATAIAELNAGQLDAALRYARVSIPLTRNTATRSHSRSSPSGFPAGNRDLKTVHSGLTEIRPLRTLLGIAQFALGDSKNAAATLSAAIAIDPAVSRPTELAQS